jgi:hypothetical protein
MGRQTEFHALRADIRAFLDFIRQRDPVIVTIRDSDFEEVRELRDPSSESTVLTLWNQNLLPTLRRAHVVVSGRNYYSFDSSLPILELSPSRFCDWNGRQALLSGRIYGTFDSQLPRLGSWYNALIRWIRKHFVKSSLPLIPHIGPAAYDWYRKGGLLLPMMIPPAVTPVWLSWVEAQDQHRAVFSP